MGFFSGRLRLLCYNCLRVVHVHMHPRHSMRTGWLYAALSYLTCSSWYAYVRWWCCSHSWRDVHFSVRVRVHVHVRAFLTAP